MPDCGFCGGPRMNGTPMKKYPDEGWRPFNGTVAPASETTKYACRSCARKKSGLPSKHGAV